MNFSYGIISIVGVLAAISIGFIVMDPNDIIEPRALKPDTNKIAQMKDDALSMTTIISIPVDAAVPGCEDTNECYLPYEITVSTSTTVSWSNDDFTAHTVTSRTMDNKIDNVFDSGLFMAGDVYEFTFDESGTYNYFCIIHPWMTGIVNVN